ncbi:MAG: hypothetical protein VB997_08970 [Opitutales bacterium]
MNKKQVLFTLLSFLPAGLFAAVSSAGDVVNQASIGAPFAGFSSDASGAVRNAVGPTARFIAPIRLVARSGDSKVAAGSATQLVADLLLDDGTVTNLPAEEVAWAVDTALATVSQSGVLTATQVTERVRVKVTATADGFAAEVHVRLMPAPTTAAAGPQIPAALAGSTEILPGWRHSPWFGAFFATQTKWLHHANHGWLYFEDAGNGSLWMWKKNHEWLWTGPNVYPHLYRHKDSTWLYFMLEALPQRAYYNHTTKHVETAQP